MAKEEYLGKIVTALSGVNQGKAPELSHIKRIANALESVTKASGKSVVDMLDSTSTTEVTHDELVALRDEGKLTPGALYRITDYVATTTQNETRSANHPFDIIVVADSEKSLNENALAARHEGDEYFELANFGGWKMKYCLDNDHSRFAWADEENGKGVIYWMQDEWENEAYYDFKGIQFLRSADWFGNNQGWAQDIFDGEVPDEDKYFYFLSVLVNGEVKDASLIGNSLVNDDGKISGVHGNKDSLVSEYYIYADQSEGGEGAIYALPKNCLVGICFEEGYYGCYSNTFRNNCYLNTFGDSCSSNTFGNNCYSNTFGNDNNRNIFKNCCYRNTFKRFCSSNILGDDCVDNNFGTNCSNNIFGNGCNSNAFGNDCSCNTFGNNCRSNTLGGNFCFNTFGDECRSNTINTNQVKFATVYSKISHSQINVVANVNYPQFVGKDSSGTVRVWTIGDIINA